MDILDKYFTERDKQCILAIPLSEREQNDSLIWAFSKSEEYTVSSAYLLGKGCEIDNFHQAWVEIWKADVSPKVRHFFWRLCTNTLPVKSLLHFRHLTTDVACPWCATEAETVNHAFVGCWRVRELWDDCRCSLMAKWGEYDSFCDLVVSWKGLEPRTIQRGMFLAWCIWGERNNKVFQNKSTPNAVLVERVGRYVEEQGKYAARIYGAAGLRSPPSPSRWHAPPANIVKINADASLADEGWVGLGAVIRDHEVKLIVAATRRHRAFWSPEISEAKALLFALKLGRRYGFQEVILESDCKLIIEKLTKKSAALEMDMVLGDILALCSNFMSVKWSHVRRDGNCVAHNLAKFVPFGFEQLWENHVPQEISSFVLMDSLSLD
ncbi:uncharacterized protein LOC110685101 [Chenopodium quinoa]|uniref:uncharacterized protein LOC110685101 n=1 Tax=Chenopodium quinoa TaxID=63459 RepID=UPI000B77B41F|nr:uncharacterized protein LOC110685101 [Chenopodium quinoa]